VFAEGLVCVDPEDALDDDGVDVEDEGRVADVESC
jgi:hypothetical protein